LLQPDLPHDNFSATFFLQQTFLQSFLHTFFLQAFFLHSTWMTFFTSFLGAQPQPSHAKEELTVTKQTNDHTNITFFIISPLLLKVYQTSKLP
jgi:hypothetical protein